MRSCTKHIYLGRKVLLGVALSLAAMNVLAQSNASSSSAVGYGINPQLPAPEKKLIPTVNVAPAKGWPEHAQPTPVAGTQVNLYAEGLEHPRWLYLLPNGDVLVAETNAPRSKSNKGFSGWVRGLFMKQAGAAVESANRITLLRDADKDGVIDFHAPFLEGLNSPFGMVLLGTDLYIANTDAIVHFTYNPGDTKINSPGTRLVDLPAGSINYHWTKNIIASADGSKLYVTVGSNSNIGETGMAAEEERAAILEVDISTGKRSIYAFGLRNPNGLA